MREIVAAALDATWDAAIQAVEAHLHLSWEAEAVTAALKRGRPGPKKKP